MYDANVSVIPCGYEGGTRTERGRAYQHHFSLLDIGGRFASMIKPPHGGFRSETAVI